MEGLAPSDALWYPLMTGSLLAGLYFLLKWLDDPDLLNRVLNWYLSTFGAFSTARLLADATNVGASFVFPERFSDQGRVWTVHARDRQARSSAGTRSSPLAHLRRVRLAARHETALWNVRNAVRQPFLRVDVYVRGLADHTASVYLVDIASAASAVVVGLWFNLVSRPWWLTNVLSIGFGYQALQLVSPTTFWTGTLVLSSLFVYDIYFVFFTPMMIHVATKLDIPVKLQFPRPALDKDEPGKQSLAMLGLGDVVLPGIIMALALRFDLFLFYLQKRSDESAGRIMSSLANDEKKSALVQASADGKKPVYKVATGSWGERFWLGNCEARRDEGGVFPKPYFYASVGGYVVGLICTLVIMHTFKHGQPALLYLVPGVLISLWCAAFVRGEVKAMWAYTEDVGPETQSTKNDASGEKPSAVEAKAVGAVLDGEESKQSEDAASDTRLGEHRRAGSRRSSDGGLVNGTDGNASGEKTAGKDEDRDTLIDFRLRFDKLGDEDLEETVPLPGSDETHAPS